MRVMSSETQFGVRPVVGDTVCPVELVANDGISFVGMKGSVGTPLPRLRVAIRRAGIPRLRSLRSLCSGYMFSFAPLGVARRWAHGVRPGCHESELRSPAVRACRPTPRGGSLGSARLRLAPLGMTCTRRVPGGWIPYCDSWHGRGPQAWWGGTVFGLVAWPEGPRQPLVCYESE